MEGKPGGNWPSADKEQMCALGLGPCSVGSFPSLQVGRDPQDSSLPDPRLLNRIPTPTAQAGPPLHRELVSRSEKQRLRLKMSALISLGPGKNEDALLATAQSAKQTLGCRGTHS